MIQLSTKPINNDHHDGWSGKCAHVSCSGKCNCKLHMAMGVILEVRRVDVRQPHCKKCYTNEDYEVYKNWGNTIRRPRWAR